MGKIYCILGKSSTGKDTIYNKILKNSDNNLKKLVLYTTRPIRENEIDGETYHFVDEKEYEVIRKSGTIVEERVYNTVFGPWRYFTVDDGHIDLSKNSYITIGVLSSYTSLRDYYGSDKVIPIYIEVDDGTRLQRALDREKLPENRKFTEMCRRFIADSEDFSEENIAAAGITKRFYNEELSACVHEIMQYIMNLR